MATPSEEAQHTLNVTLSECHAEAECLKILLKQIKANFSVCSAVSAQVHESSLNDHLASYTQKYKALLTISTQYTWTAELNVKLAEANGV